MIYYFIGTTTTLNAGLPIFVVEADLKDLKQELQEILSNYTSDDFKNTPDWIPRIFKVEVTEIAKSL